MLTTDLDGTLLNETRRVSVQDRATLAALGAAGYLRVAATGRSLHSANNVLPADLPLDYLVYSTGVGAVTWPEQQPVFAHCMSAELVAEVASLLESRGADYMLQGEAPDTHRFRWRRGSQTPNPDFDHRLDLYTDFAIPLRDPGTAASRAVSQFVVIAPPPVGLTLLATLRDRLGARAHVVRTTSPLDGESMWIEVFPPGVSKASGCATLATQHDVAVADVLAVGNDFNDLDMLEWAGTAFVVDNSPPELRVRFEAVAGHTRSGVTDAVRRWRPELLGSPG